jgi:hypothetical protein
MALDSALYCELLEVKPFAKIWKVDRRTIDRDLDMFEELGYKAKKRRRKRCTVWTYPPDQKPMFERTIREFEEMKPVVEAEPLD